jgi:hypothetical protein
MRLVTIWTIGAMSFRERLNRTGELAMRTLAHRLPRKLAYWSFIDTGVRYIQPDEIVPEVHYTDLLQRAGVDIMGHGG